MNDLAPFERYVRDALGVELSCSPWAEAERQPYLLRQRYSFFRGRLLGASFLVMLDRRADELSPAVVQKHLAQVRRQWDGEIVYARDRVTAYNRRRMIEHKIPFIIAGNQLYLPPLGIDLREHFRKLRSPTPTFSPATQALVVCLLLGERARPRLTPGEAARELGYTPMTMTRAFDELEAVNLVEIAAAGRQRRLIVPDARRELWESAQPFLRSPVRRRFNAVLRTRVPPGPWAGLSALARYADLAAPDNPAFAVSRDQWRSLTRSGRIREWPAPEAETVEIEVWSYSPCRAAVHESVDRLSLYLSLRGQADERVEAALEETLRGARW